MSRCDLQIEFYRPDRVFRTGDKVQGWVRVNVDRNVRCRNLNLVARWGTHGQGNPARKNYFQDTLFQGQWIPGEKYEYTFEFEPPPEPLTYHGHYLNVDHFVLVRADIPWALDPRCEEDFLWLPGSVVPAASTESPPPRQVVQSVVRGIFLLISAALLLCGLFFLTRVLWLGIFLLLVPWLLLGFAWRQEIARWRLGPVEWQVPGQISPGQSLTTRVSVGPGRRAAIRDISLRLAGRETVVSGSGSSQSTYRHELVSQTFFLARDPASRPNEVLDLEHTLTFPDIEAWSIDLPNNQVLWSLRLRIRLGWWPDWTWNRTIRLTPEPVLPVNENPAFQPESTGQLIELIGQLAAVESDQSAIDRLIAENGQRLFDVHLSVGQVTATEEQFDDPEYAHGRTMLGTLNASNRTVSVRVTRKQNEMLDSLLRGASWSCTGVVTGWNPRTRLAEVLAF